MNLLKRLWLRLTGNPTTQDHQRSQQMIDEMLTICLFFGVELEDTRVWDAFDIPYNPISALTTEEHAVDTACRTQDLVERRGKFYDLFKAYGDISPAQVAALQCTGEWHEFNDWLADR